MNFRKVINWLFKQSRPFIPSILLIIFLGAVSALLGVGMALASKHMIDYASNKQMESAAKSAGVFFLIVAGQVAIRAVLSTFTVRTQEVFCNKLRVSLYDNVVRANWGEVINYHSDDMLTRMTSDIQVITDGIVNILPGIITLGLQLAFSFATLFYFDRVLALLAILIGPLTVLFYRLFKKKLKSLHIKIQESESIYRAYLHECLQNIGIVKVFTLEDTTRDKVDELQNTRTHWVLTRNRLNVKAGSILTMGYYTGYLLSFGWGALRLAQNRIGFGTLTAFFQLVSQVQSPFVSIARAVPQLIAAEGSASRLMELENLNREESEPKDLGLDRAGLVLKNVAYSYQKNKPVIVDATAEIKPGEIVAIVGPSGEGKTTIIRLLLSLLHKQEGNILVTDGKSQYTLDASFRKLISYVPQGNTLFSGTILENLKMGLPDATLDEVNQALKDACAYDFVYALKDNVHTLIGERGLGLSEGQAQRIAIARALLRQVPIMIFDEATSALDEVTEMHVLNAIKNRPSRPTCIFITHRPGVYALSDRILRLEKGILKEIAG